MTKKFCVKVLPSDFQKMETYVLENKSELTEQVVSSIEHAIDENLLDVEVFSFQNTDYVIVINVDTFLDNLDNIYNYYIDTEQYEFCERVTNIKRRLTNYTKSNEQNIKTNKRQQPKNSAKPKNKRHNTD